MTTLPARAWLSATFALELATFGQTADATRAWLQHELTLTKRGSHGAPDVRVPFWAEAPGWLHLPKGYLLSEEGSTLRSWASSMEVLEKRSTGQPLPSGIRFRPDIVLNQPPYPPGQSAFVEAIVQASRANRHGGLCIAPTRSGKTLCGLAAALQLGGAVLVLVDQGNLLEQWEGAVRCFVDANGLPLQAGIVRADRFELDRPIVVGMVQTLANRALPEWARRAFGTIIVDECQAAPCDLVWTALQRFESAYVLGLTATPDRKDGLTRAIPWLIGPKIAELTRQMEADVQFQQLQYVGLVPKVRKDGTPYMGKARISFYGKTDALQAEKALMEDPNRLRVIASAAIDGNRQGRQVLIMVGLKEHVRRLNATLRDLGARDVGLYYGDNPDRGAMRAAIVVTTYKMSAKGVDFQPPPTLFIPAAPMSDLRQAVGRALQPQVPHRTLIWHPVDGHPALVKWAYRALDYYRERGFNILNEVAPAGWPPQRIEMEEAA